MELLASQEGLLHGAALGVAGACKIDELFEVREAVFTMKAVLKITHH
jgi:hypothetical protein